MIRWQQGLRTVIAVFGVGFAILLVYTMRGAKPAVVPVASVARLDPTANVEGRRGEVRKFDLKGERYRIEFERSLAYADGRQKLGDAKAYFEQHANRSFTLTGKEAEVGANQEHVVMRGAVVLTSSDGLAARTEEASYSQAEGVVRAPAAFAFTRDRVSGRSIGMTYDKNRDVLWLLDQANLKMGRPAPNEPPIDIAAGGAGMARADHYMRFERGFTMVTGARTLESDVATAYLTDDNAYVKSLEMRGHSRVTGLGEGTGALRGMQAEDINLEFAEDGKTLLGATLARSASIELSGSESAGRRIRANWIEVGLDADGKTVTGLSARDNMELILPGVNDGPSRVITSGSLVAGGTAGKGLTTARFLDHVEYRENRPASAGSSSRVVKARLLDLTTQPGLGDVDDARFSGAVRFEEDPLRAAALNAHYFVKRGAVALDGIDETTGQKPRVSDGQVTVDGQQIEMTMEGRKILAEGDVRTVMQPAPPQGKSGKDGVHRAGLLKQDQPVYATAGTMAYDGAARMAVYTKDARLWQGDTAIQGDSIAVDDATGNLTANGAVRSTLMLDQRDQKTKKTERVPAIARAEHMVYDDASRRATYTTDAHVSGPQGDLRAAKVEYYLKASGNELDRVEAETLVQLQDKARLATGDRFTYFPADERYLMVGSPVKMVADCRETLGKSLTFYKSVDTIIVDGNEDTRSQTKGGAKCGEARQD